MDQDAFRQLLQKPAGSSSFSASRNVFAKKSSSSKAQTISASEPAFKPRKVKKNDAKYRDRAAERRDGEDGDYAQVEAVLEDFEKRKAGVNNKAAVEEQSKYLGGDEEHTVLVKGLDFALVEQYKAREAAAANEDDDDLLDQALQGTAPASESSTSGPGSGSKKRTREDLIRQLKEKRGAGGDGESTNGDTEAMEEAKKQGKFKPIGFKPIGASNETKKKKKAKDGEKDGERKKKKRKVAEGSTTETTTTQKDTAKQPEPTLPEPTTSKARPVEPEPEALPDDFDIFAGVGEYEGLGDDDDEDEKEGASLPARRPRSPSPEQSTMHPRKWIDTEEPGEVEESKPSLLSSILKSKFEAKPDDVAQGSNIPTASTQDHDIDDMDVDMEHDKPLRLQPLEGSGPSARELLDLDKASGKKWKKKDKKKGDGEDGEGAKKQAAEAKAERDYKRLKNYTNSKQG